MKAQIVLSSGAHPVFLKSVLKGDIVTTFDPKHALTLPAFALGLGARSLKLTGQGG
ncbi:TPA: hypothetical protein ACGUXS_004543 [Vibrio vulnificus]